MRFVHTSDLHIGRKLDQMSLEEDVGVVLGQLAGLVADEAADALVIAGDVFDAALPSEAAVRQWDAFITRMAATGTPVLVVGGNHDSGARLACGSELVARAGVHVAGELVGDVVHVAVAGPAGRAVTFWLVPFVRPADVRAWAVGLGADASGVVDYTSAMRLVLDRVRGDEAYGRGRDVCVAHQFVTAGSSRPERSDSERLSLGTLDDVDVSVFDGFDYVALGHVHRPQRVGRDTVRYAGSPLKLSASEIPFAKSFVVVDVPESGDVSARLVPVRPLRDYRQVRGSVEELVALGGAETAGRRRDFVRATVTDDSPVDAVARLRRVWPCLAEVDFDNAATRAEGAVALRTIEAVTDDAGRLFGRFFREQAGRDLSEGEGALVARALDASSGEPDAEGEVIAS